MQVYLNGRYIDHGDATIPVDDRGFLFADGIYEVIRVYNGMPFLAEAHVQRMRNGLAALRISDTGVRDIDAIMRQLIDANSVSDGTVYIQITRGVAPRRHAFPAPDVPPTVYVLAKTFVQYPAEYFTRGVAAVTVPDTRWSRCDIKSIALLPNVLANQFAHEAGAFEALFIRDGVLIEGSHSNLFAVLDSTLMTYPASNYILAGITRTFVIELARELGITVAEAPILWEQLPDLDELFLSGTTTEVLPISHVDGRPVGSSAPGPITRRLQQAFADRTAKMTRTAAV
ncbi:MAG TPA: D-amino-acid transaminase [Longimicrobiales bacterium]|nr:D-amino-acid transaminase [Longimicrobiales bacterium]